MNNFPSLFYNILFNPSETFKTASYEKAYKLPVLIVITSSLFLLLLSENTFNFGTLFIFISKSVNLIVYWLFFSSFIELLARTFGNKGNFSKILTLTSFSYIPWIFIAPLKLLKTSFLSNFATILILLVWLWTIILQVLAISETYNISRKNAILIFFIPFLASMLYFVWTMDFFVKLFQIAAI